MILCSVGEKVSVNCVNHQIRWRVTVTGRLGVERADRIEVLIQWECWGHLAFLGTQHHEDRLALGYLPGVSDSICEKIKQGKHVDFNFYCPDKKDLWYILAVLQFDLSKIIDVGAWTVYFELNIFYNPHLTAQLVQYQGIIARFSCQFQDSAWIQYDDAFRMKMSCNLGDEDSKTL